MYDIVSGNVARARANELGIEPLVVGEDVVLITSRKELSASQALIVLSSSSDREIITGPVDGVIGIEDAERKDHFKYRRAGLDQVTAKMLASENKALVISLRDLRESSDMAKTLGRMQQNVRLAKKFGVPVVFASFASSADELPTSHDLERFFFALGFDSWCVDHNQRVFSEWVARAQNRASKDYLGEDMSKAL